MLEAQEKTSLNDHPAPVREEREEEASGRDRDEEKSCAQHGWPRFGAPKNFRHVLEFRLRSWNRVNSWTR